MNKPKSQRITPSTTTGEQIADAVHAKHPQLAVALHILKRKKKAKSARAVRAILKPLSHQFADGQSLTEILAPVL